MTVTALPSSAGTFANGIFFRGGSGLAVFNPPSDITVVPAAPRLGIRMVNGQVVLFWSTNYAEFHPQQAASLAVPVPWSEVTNTVNVVGTEYQVTVGPPTGRQFYRLAKAQGSTGAGPQMRITANGGSVSLFWPTNAANYRVEQASALPPSGTWGTVTNATAVAGTEFRVQLGSPINRAFYRLVKP